MVLPEVFLKIVYNLFLQIKKNSTFTIIANQKYQINKKNNKL